MYPSSYVGKVPNFSFLISDCHLPRQQATSEDAFPQLSFLGIPIIVLSFWLLSSTKTACHFRRQISAYQTWYLSCTSCNIYSSDLQTAWCSVHIVRAVGASFISLCTAFRYSRHLINAGRSMQGVGEGGGKRRVKRMYSEHKGSAHLNKESWAWREHACSMSHRTQALLQAPNKQLWSVS